MLDLLILLTFVLVLLNVVKTIQDIKFFKRKKSLISFQIDYYMRKIANEQIINQALENKE